MEPVKITKTLMKRLPLYLEYLKGLSEESRNVSSSSIANALGLGNVQVRKDLAKVSGEGRCRTGRSRDQLIQNIETYLESFCNCAAIAVGTDILDENHPLDLTSVNLMACFHLEDSRIQPEGGIPVYSISRMESFCKYYDVRIGILAVPEEQAQMVCDGMIACGIQDIWNASSASVSVPRGIFLRSVGAQ